MKKIISSKLLKKYIDKEQYKVISECSKIASDFGYKIYLIGGIVRDLLLKHKIKDIDITVEGSTIDFIKILQKKISVKFVKYSPCLPTAKVKFWNNVEIDFASTRSEIYPIQGELPVITKTETSLKEDVLRRDFTVNSLAVSLNQDSFLELTDYVNGISDLKNKTIRVLHDKSFYDDPSRIIRALKFSQRYNFKLDKHTLTLQNNYLENPIKNIPLKRVKDELKEVFDTVKYSAFDEFIKQKLYKIFFKDLVCPLSGKDIHDLIFDFNIKDEDIPLLYFLPIFFGQNIPEKLNLTSREISIINDVNKFLNSKINFSSDIEIKEFFDNKDYLVCVFFGLLKNKYDAKKYFLKLSKIKLFINGNDLKELGVPEGKTYKTLFKKVLAQKIKSDFKTKEDEINYLKTIL